MDSEKKISVRPKTKYKSGLDPVKAMAKTAYLQLIKRDPRMTSAGWSRIYDNVLRAQIDKHNAVAFKTCFGMASSLKNILDAGKEIKWSNLKNFNNLTIEQYFLYFDLLMTEYRSMARVSDDQIFEQNQRLENESTFTLRGVQDSLGQTKIMFGSMPVSINQLMKCEFWITRSKKSLHINSFKLIIVHLDISIVIWSPSTKPIYTTLFDVVDRFVEANKIGVNSGEFSNEPDPTLMTGENLI
ncbi:hypothetical protein [Pelagibaculum spongiae]|uniref:Uncharacterized protein n=1 Tax=Pelagibaculum spongiae TaxID=2080658 RepID=A0A2V1GTK7_9GAMM|nr:hypothetical protein [Pelagibaculum spongiae]PVZ66350.1 hypothetical protein DC094_16770 [Pelagibaculum spongiae]